MALSVAALVVAAGSTAAQPLSSCLPRDELVRRLIDFYSETSVAYGISADGTLLEVFASTDGSFTVAKTSPQGRACVVDAGVGWQMKGRRPGDIDAGTGKVVPGL